ncbi:CDP-alcohol phosphatidyltransferase family protein [Alkalicoccus urumqiensis]|uniref:CDP-alcohol phosphatidyltransferase family protein n=1 Tax=Alkalicoccus urumqiensis TaxID=1548213 RepID=A0A2P6MK06_ALKUR|nr:CDP-alcohol phosphatidyltransferase family protein [Alkalicoccus urumqiensis]PRO66620.1 CDP-alcohol phosphatidyltransferase family protein [Alkalicoccus urumqiensis]
MIDTKARHLVQPVINKSADTALKLGLHANHVTVAGFAVGIGAAGAVYAGWYMAGLALLWLSGFLDVVDGTMARKTAPSKFGTVLDISFDRLVEFGIIFALAMRFPDVMWLLLLLTGSILYTFAVFLSVGAVADEESEKSFYYQPALAERTEGFILLSLMIIFVDYLFYMALLFLTVQIITVLQRLYLARKILS